MNCVKLQVGGANVVASLAGDATGSSATSAGALTTTVGKVNGVSYGASPSTNTVPVVTGANTVTYEAVPNAALANSAIGLNAGAGVGITAPGAMTLGSTYTIGATTDTPRFAGLGLGGAANTRALRIYGSTSGSLDVDVAGVAGTGSKIILPGGTTDFSSTGGTSQVVQQSTLGGALTVGQLGFSNLSGALALSQIPVGGSSGQFISTNGSGTGSYASTKAVIGGASVNTIAQNTTEYFTNNVCASFINACQIPMPYAGTIKGCQYASNGAPASGQTFTLTLMKNGSATTNTAQITSSTSIVSGMALSADVTHTVSFNQGDLYAVQVVSSATAGTTNFSFSCELDVP